MTALANLLQLWHSSMLLLCYSMLLSSLQQYT